MMFSWFFAEPLEVGSVAPDFELTDESGRTWSLKDLNGKNVVLIFYPGDSTPTCTRQLCEMRDRWAALQTRNTLVFGINPGSAKSHARFKEKYSFPFPLLVDSGGKTASAYRAGGFITRRTVYVIGPDGIVRFARRGTPQPDEVMRAAAS